MESSEILYRDRKEKKVEEAKVGKRITEYQGWQSKTSLDNKAIEYLHSTD